MMDTSRLREAILYDALPNDYVSCSVCERRCRIPGGGRGFCGSRMNVDGRLFTLVYGVLTSVTKNPIEKKPLFHYWPSSMALSAGSWGCNLRCVYCQNYYLSMADAGQKRTSYTSPEEFVSIALEMGSEGLSFTSTKLPVPFLST